MSGSDSIHTSWKGQRKKEEQEVIEADVAVF
jgi:hypothetical protein